MNDRSWGHCTCSSPGMQFEGFHHTCLSSFGISRLKSQRNAIIRAGKGSQLRTTRRVLTLRQARGWFPARDEKGKLNPWMSYWFSLEITREDHLCTFEKGEIPSLVISTLEALDILVAVKLWFGEEPDSDYTRVLIVPSITDNRGNGAALNELMSTRFPSSALLMELASYTKARVIENGGRVGSTRVQQRGGISWRMASRTPPTRPDVWRSLPSLCPGTSCRMLGLQERALSGDEGYARPSEPM